MRWFLPVSAMIILVFMVTWMAGSFDEKVAPDRIYVDQGGYSPDSLFEVKEQKVEQFEPVPATIAAKQTAVISSRILARIEDIKVRAGDYVKKGQELVVLERSDLKSRVSQAQAKINAVDARLNEAKQSLDRSIELNKRGLLALALLEASQANFDSLQAQKKSAQQALVEAKTALNYARVVAPFDGLIVDRFAEPGNTAQPGMSLLSLYNPSSVRVEANVREARAVELEIGQKLNVDIPSKNLTLTTEIEEIVPVVNRSSRTFLMKSQINDISGLLPGMYARLYIPLGTRQRILVPKAYIAEIGQLNIVWVWQADNEQGLEKRLIKIGKITESGFVNVISGLKAGERLVKVSVIKGE